MDKRKKSLIILIAGTIIFLILLLTIFFSFPSSEEIADIFDLDPSSPIPDYRFVATLSLLGFYALYLGYLFLYQKEK